MEPITDESINREVSKGKGYTLMFYKTGPNQSVSKEESGRIQMEHLRFLFGQKRAGLVLLAGPLTGAGDLRGLCILNTEDRDAAKATFAEDPAVQAGVFVTEFHQWFGIPGDGLPE
jgi:uncharacterized protein YciI